MALLSKFLSLQLLLSLLLLLELADLENKGEESNYIPWALGIYYVTLILLVLRVIHNGEKAEIFLLKKRGIFELLFIIIVIFLIETLELIWKLWEIVFQIKRPYLLSNLQKFFVCFFATIDAFAFFKIVEFIKCYFYFQLLCSSKAELAELLQLKPHPFICMRNFIKVGNRKN